MTDPELTFKQMIADADAKVKTLSPQEVKERMNDDVLLVDIRDIRELQRDGHIPGSRHVPRGMLEFWMHPGSPYYRDYFDMGHEVVLMCNKGWRSALAAQQVIDLGMPVCHMAEGFLGWQQAGFEIAPYEGK